MASFDPKILARQVLSDLRSKPRSAATDQIAESARKVLDGNGSKQDVQRLREYLGYKRSGAGKVRGYTRAVTSTLGDLNKLQTDAEAIAIAKEQGGSTGLAEGKLVQDFTNEATKLLKTKVVKEGAKEVAKFLGSDAIAGTKFLQSITRGLRLGGAVAQVLLLGFEASENYYNNRKTSAQANTARRNIISGSGMDQRYGRDVESDVTNEVMQSRSVFTKIKDYFGFDGDTQKAITAKFEGRVKTITEARNSAAYFGVNTLDALQKAAQRKGKTTLDLTAREQTEAIDAELQDSLDPRNYSFDPWVESQLAKEFNGPLSNLIGVVTGQTKNTRRIALAQERVTKLLQYRQAQKKDQETFSEQERKRRADDPVENFKFRQEQKEAELGFSNYRSRHKAWIND